VVVVLLSACTADDTPSAGPAPTTPPTTPAATATAPLTDEEPTATHTPQPTAEATATPTGPVEVRVTVVASGLAAPWEVAFAPGRVFVTERDSGAVLEVAGDGTTTEVARLDVDRSGEGGLLGLAASPDFERDGLLYAYLTAGPDNRVVRFPADGGAEPEAILTGVPKANVHNGGRIAFGPDRLLYVATGDAAQPNLAQDLRSPAGKILRITPDGGVPDGNPFPDSPIYSLGHRNVQGLAWDGGNELYATEFGPDRDDEINHIRAGANYGWPEVTGIAGRADFVDPVDVRQPGEASWSGATFLVGGAIPQWEGDLFAAALRGQRLWRLRLDGDELVEAEELLVGEAGRLRQVVQAPDGSLWLLTGNRDGRGSPTEDDDRILRLGP
jgi:glucose/arabinose dehydrogenase